VGDVLKAVTQHFGVSKEDLESKRRTHSIVFPRQVAMNLLRQLTPLSLEEIGRHFGGRDHSTVLYAIEKMNSRRRVDANFAATLAELDREIRQSSGSSFK
jgi:chromosomal replication initiator protein